MPEIQVIPVKRRVPITKRELRKLENRKRRLNEALREIACANPEAAAIVVPRTPEAPKTVQELIDEFISQNPQWSEGTLYNNRKSLAFGIGRYAGPRLLDRELVEGFNLSLHNSDYADSTKAKFADAACALLKWAYDTDRCPKDLRKGIRWPKAPDQKPREPYTKEEYQKLLDASVGTPLEWLVRLGYHTGMAITDCINLTWKAVDLEKCIISNPRIKTKVLATISFPFEGPLYEGFKQQHEITKRVFGSVKPEFPVSHALYGRRQSVANQFKRLVAKAGVKYKSFHSWRATIATDLVEANTHPAIAMKIMGLKSAEQFISYATVTPAQVRETVARVRS